MAGTTRIDRKQKWALISVAAGFAAAYYLSPNLETAPFWILGLAFAGALYGAAIKMLANEAIIDDREERRGRS